MCVCVGEFLRSRTTSGFVHVVTSVTSVTCEPGAGVVSGHEPWTLPNTEAELKVAAIFLLPEAENQDESSD